MIIRQAEKNDVKEAIPLLIMALDEMKTVFSGYEDEEKIISKYEEFFLLEEGRYSYKNFGICHADGEVKGIIVAYYSGEGKKLDEIILKELHKTGSQREEFEKEFYDDEYYIDSVAVKPDYQGKGTAKKLIKFIEDNGKKLGYNKVSLIVHIDKEKAYSIYKKIGYEEDSKIVVYGETYRHMVKKIGN